MFTSASLQAAITDMPIFVFMGKPSIAVVEMGVRMVLLRSDAGGFTLTSCKTHATWREPGEDVTTLTEAWWSFGGMVSQSVHEG